MKKLLSLILIISVVTFFFPRTSYAVATVTLATGQTTTTNSFTTARTSNTFDCVVPALGSDQNRALWVVTVDNHVVMITGTTAGGTSMTKVVDVAAAQRSGTKVFYLPNPSEGTISIVETYSESRSDGTSYCFTTQNTAQSSPIDGTPVHGSSASATSASDSITTTANGDMVVDSIDVAHSSTGLTVGGSQTTTGNTTSSNDNDWISYQTQVTAGSISMSWTWTTANPYDHYVWPIKYLAPAGGGTAAPAQEVLMFQ